MNKLEKISIIKNLCKNINLTKINHTLIESNSKYLYQVYRKIKDIWKSEPAITQKDHIILDNTSDEYNKIIQVSNTSYLSKYDKITDYIKNTKKIIKINRGNIYFYYLDNNKYLQDINLINDLAKKTITFSKYANVYNNLSTNKIIVIWIPINKNRDYKFDIINKENLNTSIQNFNAFTASGVTFGDEPKYTIISRYEEISKLLLHELIHNFNIDGSNYHDHNNKLIDDYVNIKNKVSMPKMPNISSKKFKNYDYTFSIYESYTELLSTYFNIIYRNINLDIEIDTNTDTDRNNIIQRIKLEIIMELLYSYNTIGNLVKINGYNTWEEFMHNQKFQGNICVYEYYYLKGLMYNNYKLTLCNNKDSYNKNYYEIINVNKNDDLLKEVFNKCTNQINFSYNFYE